MADFKVGIGYEDSQFKKGIEDSKKRIKEFENQSNTTSSRYNKNVSEMTKETYKFKKQMDSLKGGINRFTGTVISGGASLNSMASSFLTLGAKASIPLAAITSIGTAITDNIQKSRAFEESISHLSALTGMSGKDLEYLKEAAIELGSSTTQSASEVAEAFMIVGSKSPELLKSGSALKETTKAAITLAEAGLIPVEEAATALTGIMNQFNIPAEKASKIMNLLGAAAQQGAGDIKYINSAITQCGAVAAAFNVPIANVVASLELLAKSGMDASSAGTNLRNILTNLSKEGFDVSGSEGLRKSLEKVLEKYNSLGSKISQTTYLTKLFGKENLAAGLTLMNTAKQADDLSKSIQNTNTAEEMAKKNNDNLNGSLKNLSSAWEGLTLSISSSNGFLKKITDMLTSIINKAKEAFTELGRVHKKYREMNGDPEKGKTKVNQQLDRLGGAKNYEEEYRAETSRYEAAIKKRWERYNKLRSELNQEAGKYDTSTEYTGKTDRAVEIEKEMNNLEREIQALENMKKEYKDAAKTILDAKRGIKEAIEDPITTDSDTNQDTSNSTTKAIEKVKTILQGWEDEINHYRERLQVLLLDPEKNEEAIRNIRIKIEELTKKKRKIEIGLKFEDGSLGALQEQIKDINDEIQLEGDPDTIRALKDLRKSLEDQLKYKQYLQSDSSSILDKLVSILSNIPDTFDISKIRNDIEKEYGKLIFDQEEQLRNLFNSIGVMSPITKEEENDYNKTLKTLLERSKYNPKSGESPEGWILKNQILNPDIFKGLEEELEIFKDLGDYIKNKTWTDLVDEGIRGSFGSFSDSVLEKINESGQSIPEFERKINDIIYDGADTWEKLLKSGIINVSDTFQKQFSDAINYFKVKGDTSSIIKLIGFASSQEKYGTMESSLLDDLKNQFSKAIQIPLNFNTEDIHTKINNIQEVLDKNKNNYLTAKLKIEVEKNKGYDDLDLIQKLLFDYKKRIDSTSRIFKDVASFELPDIVLNDDKPINDALKKLQKLSIEINNINNSLSNDPDNSYLQKLSEIRLQSFNNLFDDIKSLLKEGISDNYYNQIKSLLDVFSLLEVDKQEYSDIAFDFNRIFNLDNSLVEKYKDLREVIDNILKLTSIPEEDFNREDYEKLLDYIDKLDKEADKYSIPSDNISKESLKYLEDYVSVYEDKINKLAGLKNKFKESQISEIKFSSTKQTIQGFESINSSIQGVYNSWNSLVKSWNDPDTNDLERVFGVFNSIFDSINSIYQFIEAINAISEAINAYKIASMANTSTTATETAAIEAKTIAISGETAAISTKAAAESAAATSTATTVATSNAAKASSNAAASLSNQVLTATENTSTYASIPFVGPALAAAAQATYAALWASAAIPAFAEGGIFQGSTTIGDYNIARVNSGEMILNGKQQKNLFDLLNSGASENYSSEEVQFRIKGSDLVGTLNNYKRKKSKI